MFTSDIPLDPGKVDDECNDWGDPPDPPEDNCICVNQKLTAALVMRSSSTEIKRLLTGSVAQSSS
jgi:hypothetical protein